MKNLFLKTILKHLIHFIHQNVLFLIGQELQLSMHLQQKDQSSS